MSWKQRRNIITAVLAEENIENYKIVPVPNINDDDNWVHHVLNHTGYIDVVYAGESQKTKTLFKKAGYKIKTTKRLFKISSTEIRKRIKENKPWKDLVPKVVVGFIEE